MKSIKVMGYGLWVMGVLLVSMPAMAQWGSDNQVGASAPSTTFQSTSSMTGSNSAYASNPSIGADGMAAAPNAALHSRSITNRRNDEWDDDNIETPDDNPIGGGVLPLLLLATAYGANKLSRKGVE